MIGHNWFNYGLFKKSELDSHKLSHNHGLQNRVAEFSLPLNETNFVWLGPMC